MRVNGRKVLTIAVATTALALAWVSAAQALETAPWWGVTSAQRPASLPSEGTGQIVVAVENRGDAPADGVTAPVTVTDTLPSGLKALAVKGYAGVGGAASPKPIKCKLGTPVECVYSGEELTSLPAFEALEIMITVRDEGEVSGANKVMASGGGANEPGTLERTVSVGEDERFGIEHYELLPESVGGGIDAQAGSHPFQVTTVLGFNQTAGGLPEGQLPKEVELRWPPGLIGDPTPLPQCTDAEFGKQGPNSPNECPAESAVGVAVTSINDPGTAGLTTLTVPVFNLVPLKGEPARFGFKPDASVFVNTGVQTGKGYGVVASSHNIPQLVGFLNSTVTIWGVPGDPRHDGQRGWECVEGRSSICSLGSAATPAFLAMPTSCENPFSSEVGAESWPVPGGASQRAAGVSYTLPVSIDGCNHLSFAPEISVTPEVSRASTPTGVEVNVHMPQGDTLAPEGLSEGTIRSATVTLPEGLSVNPSSANGLEACTEAEIGFLEKEVADPAVNIFTPTLPELFCPDGAKLGTVEVETPLLPHIIKGAVYLAMPAPNGEPDKNPFSSLVALYIVAEDPVSGVLLKLPGKVVPNPVTGQLTSTFEDTPELPFENLRLHFTGGPRAALSTPVKCGTYETKASFTPWSLEPGENPTQSSSTFQITSGPGGSPCPNTRPLAPEYQAGTTTPQAGAFAQLQTILGHPDADQEFTGLTVKTPPGLLGSLVGVQLCEEARANSGTCEEGSLIGHTSVTAGLGNEPVVVSQPGRVYITSSYKGASFGLSIVAPAEAGPFNLGNVVVRAKLEVDPHTAQLTITTDPPGTPYGIPTIKDGVPLDLKRVAVTIDRSKFTFNPTNCTPTAITGSVSGSEGGLAAVSAPFNVANCSTLPFAPHFSVAMPAKHTRRFGATLTARIASSSGQANIRSLKVKLPRILPSRQDTLKLACSQAQFASNPAGCPTGALVGKAVVHTPLLPVPLTGPAVLVSHGGAGFPDLDLVLHGYGVTIVQVGTVNITKGITTVAFQSVPDAAVNSIQVTTPAGPHSILAATANLCTTSATKRVKTKLHGKVVYRTRKVTKKRKLLMPTTITGQNGAVIKQNTVISVSGCPKAHGGKAVGKGKRKNRSKH